MSDSIHTIHANETGSGAESGLLWRDCPIGDIEADRGRGYYFDERFVGGYLSGMYTATQVTAGAVALLTGIEGGAIRFTSSTTAGQGMTLVNGTAATILLGTGKSLWFEGRVRLSTISTAPQFFMGLSTYATAIITGGASPAMATADYIGFSNVAIGGSTVSSSVSLHCRDNSGTASGIAAVHTLVDGAWVNLGFRVKSVTAGLRVTVYVNNVEFATTFMAAATPDTNYLSLALVGQSGGTVSPTLDVAWRKLYVEIAGG